MVGSGSPKFSISADEWAKIGKFAAATFTGAVLAVVSFAVDNHDFGDNWKWIGGIGALVLGYASSLFLRNTTPPITPVNPPQPFPPLKTRRLETEDD